MPYSTILGIPSENHKFGWLQGLRKRLQEKNFWLWGLDLNQWPPLTSAHEVGASELSPSKIVSK
jgi:hypothetical protein